MARSRKPKQTVPIRVIQPGDRVRSKVSDDRQAAKRHPPARDVARERVEHSQNERERNAVRKTGKKGRSGTSTQADLMKAQDRMIAKERAGRDKQVRDIQKGK
jgi:hypothetical protein